jgi:hypothetical protein
VLFTNNKKPENRLPIESLIQTENIAQNARLAGIGPEQLNTFLLGLRAGSEKQQSLVEKWTPQTEAIIDMALQLREDNRHLQQYEEGEPGVSCREFYTNETTSRILQFINSHRDKDDHMSVDDIKSSILNKNNAFIDRLAAKKSVWDTLGFDLPTELCAIL